MIFIDEYQDSDLKMNDLFMFLKSSLGIDIFIVGDTKQAIYLWRGASEDIFNKIPQKMEQKYLWHNFRSHPEIVNYAMVIHDPESLPVVSKDLDEHVVIVNLGIHSLGELLKTKLIDLDKGITIIVKKNNEALVYKDKLRNEGFDFEYIPITPIDQNQSQNTQYLRVLARYFYDDNFTIFDLVEEYHLELKRSEIEKFQNVLDQMKSIFPAKEGEIFDDLNFSEIIQSFSNYLEVIFSESDISQLKETLSNQRFSVAFIPSNNKYKIMTIFAAKGLEFDQVIGFGKDYNLTNRDTNNNHYVLITRAKEKVILIDNNYYKSQVDSVIAQNHREPNNFYRYYGNS